MTTANHGNGSFSFLGEPPDDCIGSVDKLPNGQCPAKYPLNDTLGYAHRVAAAVGALPKDDIELDGTKATGRRILRVLLREITLRLLLAPHQAE